MKACSSVLMGLMVGLIGLASVMPRPAQAQASRAIRCESVNNRAARCAVPWGDARITQKLSDAGCRRGQDWGVDRRGLWVDHGCRAVFAEVHGRGDGGRGGQRRLVCESLDNRYHLCRVDLGRHGRVRLVSQHSDSRCVQGRSWGYQASGVWVNNGCRGTFEVEARRH